jgi:hypothetical protein
MRRVSFYHKDSGIFHHVQLVCSDDAAVALNTPADHIAIDHPEHGKPFDHLSEKIDVETGKAVPHKPDQPSTSHEWHEPSRRWVLKESVIKSINAKRKIEQLEQHQPRIVRELLLGDDSAMRKLIDLEHQIIELRKQIIDEG